MALVRPQDEFTLAAQRQVERILLRKLHHGQFVHRSLIHYPAQELARVFQAVRVPKWVLITEHRTCAPRSQSRQQNVNRSI